MKTISKRIVCILLCMLLIGQVLVLLAACNKKVDPETTPLTLSTDALDGVFNPFSYTSGADGGVVGQTQLGMLNIDETGKIVAGWDQPSVAEAYSVVQHGQENPDDPKDFSEYYTDYYLVLKNGVKFSDGTPLTIKDVLFNLYVYLDPVYTGSSTMYSIDIQGLNAYRYQNADDNAKDNINQQAQAQGRARVNTILGWCAMANSTATEDMSLEDYFGKDTPELKEVQEDIKEIKKLFKEELNTDWVAALTMIEEYEKYYLQTDYTNTITGTSTSAATAWREYTKEGNTNKHISEQWEVFAIMYGMITTSVEQLGERGTSSAIKKYTFEYNSSDTYDHSQDKMIDRAYMDFFPEDENGKTFKEKLATVLSMYATAGTFLDYAVSSEMEKLTTPEDGQLKFPSIEGIKVYLADSIPESAVSSGATKFDDDRYILNIRINGLDPKAIYSFSFTVAPMAYYSTKEAIDNFKELPDTKEVIAGEEVTVKNYTGFGVERSSTKFMSHINSILVPRGAGPYRASNGKPSGVDADVKLERSDFFSNNVVNFERNEYFYTVMTGGHNANIKFLRYKVIPSNGMTDAVAGKNPEVHISQPSATQKEIQKIRKLKGVDYITVKYMGYGYIGVNAKYVKDINIRRAIMSAMNVELCRDYYGDDDLVSILYRSMSSESEYYPKGATAYYPFDGDKANNYPVIRGFIEKAGYYVDSKTGILQNSDGEQLKFTFTVAGETEDHPAYQTMAQAAEILNEIGFDITVTKDSQALSKLASGGLQVWAAAWSSAIDPDMYQVYHKDSTASSVKNWGYDYLLSMENADGPEVEILNDLAKNIELGRKYMTFDERKQYYYDALDLVMKLAVELPTYQRKEMYLINTNIVDKKTLCEANIYQSPISKIWDVNFVGAGK